MSSLVLTIHNFGVPNFDPYPFNIAMENGTFIDDFPIGFSMAMLNNQMIIHILPTDFDPIDHHNAIYSIIIPLIIPLIMNTIITIYYNIL